MIINVLCLWTISALIDFFFIIVLISLIIVLISRCGETGDVLQGHYYYY